MIRGLRIGEIDYKRGAGPGGLKELILGRGEADRVNANLLVRRLLERGGNRSEGTMRREGPGSRPGSRTPQSCLSRLGHCLVRE